MVAAQGGQFEGGLRWWLMGSISAAGFDAPIKLITGRTDTPLRSSMSGLRQ
jgi:hypothetical protein